MAYPETTNVYKWMVFILLPLLGAGLSVLSYREVRGRAPVATSSAPPPLQAPPASAASTAFTEVYEKAVWGRYDGGFGTSGTGSTLANTAVYRTYLQAFLKQYDIRSVVDAGCGDWEFSQAIDWTGIDYRGYDVVAPVIAKNKEKYGKPNVQFFVGNIVEDDLPAADLVIVKHVLQHIPNAHVAQFINKQLPKYKHALLTNGVSPLTMSAENRDIAVGDYRELDPTVPPFSLPGRKELTWSDNLHMHQVVHVIRK